MFPPKIIEFTLQLLKRTENGEFYWTYDDNNATVRLTAANFTVSLRYSFNGDEGYGEFVMFYLEFNENKEYRFYTNQLWTDYDTVRRLYDSAQSSGIKLPF